MRLGILDIGNTKVKLFSVTQNFNLEFESFEWSEKKIKKKLEIFSDIIISNVRFDDIDIKTFLKSTGVNFIYLDYNTPLPIKLDYNTIETLGKDRIATAVAAYYEFPNEATLIFDIGSCITIDFIDDSGVFNGGRISPGLQMRLKAMHNQTGQLPLVEISENILEIGKSTNEAILGGAFLGILYEIEGTIANFKKRYDSINIILTGGDAFRFDKRVKNSIFADKFFLLKGLKHIFEYNEKTNLH